MRSFTSIRYLQSNLGDNTNSRANKGTNPELKGSIIDQLDIFREKNKQSIAIVPVKQQENHKFKGPKDRFKEKRSILGQNKPQESFYTPTVRKTKLLRQTPTNRTLSKASLSPKEQLRASRVQLEEKTKSAYKKMQELREAYERRKIEKQQIILQGIVRRSESKERRNKSLNNLRL